MKIDFNEIEKLLKYGNLRDISRRTNIPLRTLENYKYKTTKGFENMKKTLIKLQNIYNEEETNKN